MKSSNAYKFFGILLVIVFIFLYTPQAKAEFILNLIEDIPWLGIVLAVLAVVVIAFAVGAVVAQIGLTVAAGIFTTVVGTAIVAGAMVGAGLWAADCLFDGSPIDPNIICTGTAESGAEGGQANLEVDVKVNGSDGPLTFRAPATFKIQWAIAGADSLTSCSATGDWSGDVSNATGETTLSEVVKGNYNYGIRCIKAGNEVSDNVVVQANNLPDCSFSSSPKTIVKPGKSTLSWECQYADSCQISNGAVTPVSNTSGTLEVKPDVTTTYILTCNNIDGPINLTTEVKVLTPDLHEIPPGG